MPDARQHVNINLQGVTTTNDAARHIVAGFAEAMPTLADTWRFLLDALNDVPLLVAKVSRLTTELHTTRLDLANMRAAARATIAAHHDGEADPLYYLRDELHAQTSFPGTQGGMHE